MKTVVTSSMVAHLWAHQSQPSARNSVGSFSFDGPVLFSYRTPIAMIHETRAGRVVLVTSDGYSTTTKTRHLPETHRAASHLPRFHVPYVGAYGGMAPRDPFTLHSHDPRGSNDSRDAWHERNIAHLVAEYNGLGGRIRRAGYTYHASRESVHHALQEAADIVTRYCDAFRIKKAARPALDPADDARVIWRAREIRAERANDPKYIAQREAAKAARERRLEEREREKRAREHERTQRNRELFRLGASGYGRPSDERGGALLRLAHDGTIVQTSWGAECPADDARRVWPLVCRVRERGEAWKPEGIRGMMLGQFPLSHIDADGTLWAGCHRIHWGELEQCARALGLLS